MARVIAVLVALAATGCAYDRAAAYSRLSEEQKTQYAKYQQFMTDRQQVKYLQFPLDEERDAFVRSLRVEERLTAYPQHWRDAIWAREVVPGMTPEAVLLSWGPPERTEKTTDPMHQGLPQKVWYYRGGVRKLVFVEGVVSEVEQ